MLVEAQVLGGMSLVSPFEKETDYGPRLALENRRSTQGETTMLRITIHNDSRGRTFQLEGKLAGPWVDELERCWQDSVNTPGTPAVRFDLTGVTFIDAAAK